MNSSTTDIDECKVKDNNNCTSHQKCVNKPGSYDCLCIEGYHEAEPERVCVPDRSAGQSSLAIYLAVGEYFYCMSVYICAIRFSSHGKILCNNKLV